MNPLTRGEINTFDESDTTRLDIVGYGSLEGTGSITGHVPEAVGGHRGERSNGSRTRVRRTGRFGVLEIAATKRRVRDR